MFHKNEYVMHSGEGVCLVEDIRDERFAGTAPKQYYILRPVYENTGTTVFLPVDSEAARLRPLLTGEQIEELLATAENAPSLWVENDRQRQDTFNRLLREGDPASLLRLVLDIRQRQKDQAAAGRKLRFFDEKTLQEAQRFIRQEYAHVLGMEPEAVSAFIARQLVRQDSSPVALTTTDASESA